MAADEEGFRTEVRAWLSEHLRGDYLNIGRSDLGDADAWPVRLRWERELAAAGYVGLSWPREYGGRDLTLAEQVAFADEYAAAGAPDRAGFFGEQLLGPLLLVHGTPEQRARFVPPILAAQEFWCQGYSEPDAGSDLAAVTTRAELDGDRWRITGQKVWTSLAQFADWIFVLCRTDPAAARHHGLSLLLCPLDQPGVEVRPIRQLTGGREFNEVFFDGAETAKDLVVGPVNGGWKVAMAVLGFERGTAFLGKQREFVREFEAVVALMRQDGRAAVPAYRDRLVELWIGLQVMRHLGLRIVHAYSSGGAPGAEASVTKLQWSQWHQRLGDLAMDVGGMASTVLRDGRYDRLQHEFLFSRQDTISAGSSEIQRNVIAEQVLGLPR